MNKNEKLKQQVIGGVGNSTLKAQTGNDFETWKQILDAVGGKELSHHQLAVILHTKYKVSEWWSQMIANAYEQMIGRRKKGQMTNGKFQLSVSKTFPTSVKDLWNFMTSFTGYSIWLSTDFENIEFCTGTEYQLNEEQHIEIRSIKQQKQIRVRNKNVLDDSITTTDIAFFNKPNNRSSIVIGEINIPNEDRRDARVAHWKSALDAISTMLVQVD